jgi:ribonuclease HI
MTITSKLWFDGARYFDHSKYAYILETGGVTFKDVGLSIGTNVDAEFDGLINGLKKAIDLDVSHLTILGDSKNVLHQITGQQRSRRTKSKLQEALALLEYIQYYSIEWVPSAENPAHNLF